MFALIVIFLVGLFYHVYQCYRMRNLPPYIEGAWPIIGHSFMILRAKNLHNLMTFKMNSMLKKRIEVVTIRVGILDLHGISSPDDAYLIANSCLQKDHTLYDFFKPFFGEGLITANVPKWKIHRKLLNPTFNQHVLDGYLYEFNNQTRQFLETVALEAGKGPFDHYNKYLTQSILKTVCATSMGTSIDEEDISIREGHVKCAQEYLNLMTERIYKFWLHNDLVFKLSGHKKRLDMIADEMNTITRAIFKKKKAEFHSNQLIFETSEKRFKSFVEQLLELSEAGELNEQEISDELNTFIAAGSDTMSLSISNILTCVGTYQTVQDKILEDHSLVQKGRPPPDGPMTLLKLREVGGWRWPKSFVMVLFGGGLYPAVDFYRLTEVFQGSDRDVEKQDLLKLKYLEAVIKETLRLYPAVPFIGRVLDKETEIQGYTLPAGSKCYILIYALLRHWTWGADAHIFRPERWLDGSLPHNLKGWAAFGIGKRSCIGSNFAIICMKTVLAGFLRRYSIKGDVTQMTQEFTIISKPVSGHEISIENRHR